MSLEKEATDRLASATIEVCARLMSANDQILALKRENERLRHSLHHAHTKPDRLREIVLQEAQLAGVDLATDRPIADVLHALISKLGDDAQRARAAHSDELTPIALRLEHWERLSGGTSEGSLVDRLERLIGEFIPAPLELPPQCKGACSVPRFAKLCTVCGHEEIPF